MRSFSFNICTFQSLVIALRIATNSFNKPLRPSMILPHKPFASDLLSLTSIMWLLELAVPLASPLPCPHRAGSSPPEAHLQFLSTEAFSYCPRESVFHSSPSSSSEPLQFYSWTLRSLEEGVPWWASNKSCCGISEELVVEQVEAPLIFINRYLLIYPKIVSGGRGHQGMNILLSALPA